MSATIDVYRIGLDQPARSGCADRALREILTRHLGAPPAIVTAEHGKPQLAGGELEFNLSHSGTWAVIAISRAGPVGIDVEAHRVMRGPSIADRFFTAAEAAIVAADPAAFFRLWTRKEAWAKAQGLGLRVPLDQVDVSGDVPGWSIIDLDLGPGYSAAVARPGPPGLIRLNMP